MNRRWYPQRRRPRGKALRARRRGSFLPRIPSDADGRNLSLPTLHQWLIAAVAAWVRRFDLLHCRRGAGCSTDATGNTMPEKQHFDLKLHLHHAPIEIERKCLIANDAWKDWVVRSVTIRDGLIAAYKDRKVRVRISDQTATRTCTRRI